MVNYAIHRAKMVVCKMIDSFHVDRKKNKMKKLDPDSEFNKADKNGDNLITHQELEDEILRKNASLDREERRIRMENADKKEDQQRYMVWFSMLTVTILIIVVLIPGLIPVERLDHIGPILSTFLISNMGVIGTFFGLSAWTKNKTMENGK
tara:strand:+ start:182 stop:634 length:453 start_codon:yes stop_codon:yes gene_type:complete